MEYGREEQRLILEPISPATFTKPSAISADSNEVKKLDVTTQSETSADERTPTAYSPQCTSEQHDIKEAVETAEKDTDTAVVPETSPDDAQPVTQPPEPTPTPVEAAPLLWTVEERTIFENSSLGSLERVRSRLECLLLGVNDAIRGQRLRQATSSDAGTPRSLASRKAERAEISIETRMTLVDQSIRRILGEAFTCFTEEEVVQLVQLCSLADKGVGNCDVLVRNAVTVLQGLTNDGDAVRSLTHFHDFVAAHRREILTEQWRHDFATALRSLAIGYLREPMEVMRGYGNSVMYLVDHEVLYIALLRLSHQRVVGEASAQHSVRDHQQAGLWAADSADRSQCASAATPRGSANPKFVPPVVRTPRRSSTPTGLSQRSARSSSRQSSVVTPRGSVPVPPSSHVPHTYTSHRGPAAHQPREPVVLRPTSAIQPGRPQLALSGFPPQTDDATHSRRSSVHSSVPVVEQRRRQDLAQWQSGNGMPDAPRSISARRATSPATPRHA